MQPPAKRWTDSQLRSSSLLLLFTVLATALTACGTTEETTPPATDTSAVDGGSSDASATDVATIDVATTDVATSDGSVGDSATANPDKWWECSDWESESGTKTPRLSACEATFDDGKYGCKAPWYGVTQAGTNYTCNSCRGGDPEMQGKWRFVDFTSEDPTTALPNGRKELLIVDGNTWHLRTGNTDKDGKWREVKVDGWYWCSDAAELKTKDNGFHVTKVAGDKDLGWFAPDVFTGHFLSSGPNLRAWGFFADFNKTWAGDFKYCRVGSTVGGKACTDPFK